MKLKTFKYSLLAMILLFQAKWAGSQDIASGLPVESVKMCTDRTMYITGEKIRFSADVSIRSNFLINNLSRILYCELVSPDGTHITGGKYVIENSSAQGCLVIPEETNTGVYYLKSYTKWMRNGDPGGYSYIMLKLINPDKTDIMPGFGTIDTGKYLPLDGSITGFQLTTDQQVYHAGDRIDIMIKGDLGQYAHGKFALSVVPAASWDSISILRDSISAYRDSISAETRGISLSGKLLEDKTGIPVVNALVNLSIIGDKDVMAIRTDNSGRFNFALPGYTGSRDIFLCGEEPNGIAASIYIDNDYCSKPVSLPSPEFDLTMAEEETAFSMAVNRQLNSVFAEDTLSKKVDENAYGEAFYGKPDEVLVMEKFIDLPSVEEYFSELVGSVNVRKYEGRKIFRFLSPRIEMTIYDPLVMIDMVAVNDINKILAMSPRLIERIELVNSPYIKGNITYGGIISFFSKNGDFAGIDLPTSGTFINYQFLEDCPGTIPDVTMAKNIPDTRNTVYWDPDLLLDGDGKAEASFKAPETPGLYVIVLKGMNINNQTWDLQHCCFSIQTGKIHPH